ncbi:lipoyl synthase [Thiohalorhabdus methylotrophus]|uniref:Lipoyl synthase n=1 Tax=Thiohalorhabdus methylotrophus TaxID=3242694 RepID=A0ABV4TXS2_9GAMM
MRKARFDRDQPDLGRKPGWLRVRSPSDPRVHEIKQILRSHELHTVCEEASCPNLGECFGGGTATFMILGEVCTRRCSFCDVATGRPAPPDPLEPAHLASAVADMGLEFAVITSVDRDDLTDGGAGQFAEVIRLLREQCPDTGVEILTPDFRGCEEEALTRLADHPPNVFNHNVETVPELYYTVRPSADYQRSLRLLRRFRDVVPDVPTKSGLMLGLGEELDQVRRVMADLRAHGVDILTLGQYLAPSGHHHPVRAYIHPDTFAQLKEEALGLGFLSVNAGPLVRSSYHAGDYIPPRPSPIPD